MQQALPTNVSIMVEAITRADAEVAEIWLIGSRANGNERVDSDWDLLVFGGPATPQTLVDHIAADRAGIDVLVVHNDDDFKDPWGSAERCKSGSLSGWQWTRLSEFAAVYVGTKWDDQANRTISTRRKAHRLWPGAGEQPF
jgi:predicted nucleotidyltransferase